VVVAGSMAESDFNPRSPAGSDFNGFSTSIAKNISIHAPLRGATTG